MTVDGKDIRLTAGMAATVEIKNWKAKTDRVLALAADEGDR
jgi:hypothetical protein